LVQLKVVGPNIPSRSTAAPEWLAVGCISDEKLSYQHDWVNSD